MICSNCGQENPEGFRFCGRCGQPLEPVAAGPAEERKVVTVLFADVTGSTALGERLDPERLKDVMGSYFAAMREEIEAEGGTVEKFIGDAVMAAFGVPTAHEDDPARALRAALRMLDRLEVLNGDLSAVHGVELRIRIGVNTGDVMAAVAPLPGDPMVSGDAVNVAARLEQTAEPGSVVASERTARATRGFTFRPLGSLELRGKGRGVNAFELTGQRIGAPERGIPGLRAPMVGRDRELELLRSIHRAATSEGRPHLVTVFGDAGIGKSRLVTEFLGSVESSEPAPLILRGRCLPYGDGITYWPLAEILKGHAGALDTDPPEVALEKIRKLGADLLTSEWAADPERATAALAYTVGVEDPAVDFRAMAPRQVRAEVHAGWRSFFSALASTGPVVVVVEDIHWADPAMLDLLEDLADRAQGPLVFLCPSRPELTARRPGWGGGRRSYSSIDLEPLSAHDADGLVALLLAVEELPLGVREQILERAEGNPFYLEEIIRGLIDSGRIRLEGEHWRAAQDIAEVEIPDTVQGVLAARIDLLDPKDKRTLQLAAVVGRVFWTGPLARLLGDDPEQDGSLADALERLQDRELVLARLGSTMAGQEELIFKHVLTRDVAYDSLPRRDRVRAHAEAAAWIEDTAGERRDEFVELLAHHYGEAFRGARDDARAEPATVESLRRGAFLSLVKAAEDARSKMATTKASRLAEQAQALAATPEERATTMESLGMTAHLEYRGDEAWRWLRDAADLRAAEAPEDGRSLARVCGRALEVPTRWPGSMRGRAAEAEARPYVELGLGACPSGDGEERARLLLAQGFWAFAFNEARHPEGFDRSARAADEARSMAARLGRADLEVAALDAINSVPMIQGNYRGLWPNVERRFELLQRYEDPWELGDTYALAAWISFETGRYGDAIRYGVDGADRVMSEVPGQALHCLVRATMARFHAGGWDDLLTGFATLREILGDRSEEPPPFASIAYGPAALVHELRGENAVADHLIEIQNRSRLGEEGSSGYTDAYSAMLSAIRGRWDMVFERLWRQEEGRRAWPILFSVECDLTAEAGRWDDAGRVLDQSRRLVEEAGLEGLAFFADRLEGRTALAGGNPPKAIELLRRAVTGFESLEADWEVAVTELHLARALRAVGADATAELRRALEVFERVGAIRQAAAARELPGAD